MAVDYPTNETPSFLMNPLQAIIQFLGHYGWGMLFAAVSLTILWAELHPRWKKWREKKRNQESEAELVKNPDIIIAREEALSAARRNLQEKYNMLAAQHAEKMKEKEESRRLEKLKELERLEKSGGIHSKNHCQEEEIPSPSSGSNKKDKNSGRLRGDYNPLIGPGGGASYRPARRCTSGGGG